MLIGTREAIRILVDSGMPRRRSQQALVSGLAGAEVRTGQWVLYDRQRVLDLARRTTVSDTEVVDLARGGLAVMRAQVDVRQPRVMLDQAFAASWLEVSPWERLWWDLWTCPGESVPFIGTVAGFVVYTADLRHPTSAGEARALRLHPPGAWAERVAGRRLRTGPGRPWELWPSCA